MNAGDGAKSSDRFSAAAVLNIKAVWFVTAITAIAFAYVG
jgi:hypothetical protein